MRRATVMLLLAAFATASSPAADAQRFGPDDRETLLLSRSAAGGFPDGASRDAAVSGDYQLASRVAFASDATDIVPGDSNGATDVFLVRRARPYSIDGEPWRPGATVLVSRGRGGGPANGPSYRPDLGGDRHHRPRCVAFVSEASNLVPGDTNGAADAFVQDLATGRTVRVSVGAGGRQANGDTTEVQVDGGCTRVAFVSGATNLALRRSAGARRGLASSAPRGDTSQVYMRVLKRRGSSGGFTFLASASGARRAGNGDSTEVSLARVSGRAAPGAAVAYTSAATNLVRADRGRGADVYLTRLVRRHRSLRRVTTLVSRTRGGRPGDGASDQPDVVAGGRFVVFRTTADDLLPGDANGVADVARAATRHPGRFLFVSRSQAIDQNGNGASGEPSAVEPGTNVFFSSAASNLQSTARGAVPFDRNGAGDVFFWSALTGNASLQSRDSDNEILNNTSGRNTDADKRHVVQAPAQNPAVSYYGNYLLFESPYPLIDLAVANRRFPGLDPSDAARMSNDDPSLRQVYLRYIGPR